MRGKVLVAVKLDFLVGITPAYAGKSHFYFRSAAVVWDHPRLCGEKDRVKHCGTMLMGSPPPMRGKVVFGNTMLSSLRITPAYAGKR